MGLNPTIESKTCLKVLVPRATEELRQNLAKKVHSLIEENKIKIRSVRATELSKLKKLKSGVSTNDISQATTEIQNLTDGYCQSLDKLETDKKLEILSRS
jgi:ribosome recycling factor